MTKLEELKNTLNECNVFYLYDTEKKPIFKLSMIDNSSYKARLYEVTRWEDKFVEYESGFIAEIFFKWDACTHWNFYGEDYIPTDENTDSYYHICGTHCFCDHIRAMCFAWKVMMFIKANEQSDYIESVLEYYWNDNKEIQTLIDFMLNDYEIYGGYE